MSHRPVLSCILIFAFAAPLHQTPAQSSEGRRLRNPEADTNRDGVLTPGEVRQFAAPMLTAKAAAPKNSLPVPTHSNVRYGDHERNVFDLWLPTQAGDATKHTVYVFFHGGGFLRGDKSSFNPTPFLNAGMAVVSANYRFVDGKDTLSPAPLLDGARVIQFLRAHAEDWQLDPSRIAVSGSSAGAVMTLWIGYHTDLADPDDADPVARQSSRVQCIIPLDGPTNLDPRWITANMGGPKHVHQSFPFMFGGEVTEIENPDILNRVNESSAMPHVSADDPPTLLIYGGKLEGIPLPESASTGVLIHHPYFGKELKTRLDDAGVPCEFHHSMKKRRTRYAVILKWLKKHLSEGDAE